VQLGSQNSRLLLKHLLLLNVCHHTFAQFFVRKYLVRYIHDFLSHFLPLNIKVLLLIFYYLWHIISGGLEEGMQTLIWVPSLAVSCRYKYTVSCVECYCDITNKIICFWLHQFGISVTLNRQYFQKINYRNFFCACSLFRQPSGVMRSGDKIIDHSREASCWLTFKSYAFLNWLIW